MRLAALISGGKDSMLALHKAVREHEIVCLVGAIPENPYSLMFHTYNLHLIDVISYSLQLPIFKIPTAGMEEQEVEDLQKHLGVLDVDGIITGAIESEYQRSRFDRMCRNLGLELVAPLWHEDVDGLMKEIVENYSVMIVSVSAMGLDESWLGKKIDEQLLTKLQTLNKKYGVHIAGEGGEYETLVLDAPLFRERIVIKGSYKEWKGDAGYLEITDFRLEEKKK